MCQCFTYFKIIFIKFFEWLVHFKYEPLLFVQMTNIFSFSPQFVLAIASFFSIGLIILTYSY